MKKKFENQKRAARKQPAESKFQRNLTGGGRSTVKDDDPLTNLTLSIINGKNDSTSS